MRKKFLLMILILSLFSSMGGGYLYGQNESDGVIDTESELRAALTAGGNVQLGCDIEVNSTIEILRKVRVNLDLNGYKIFSSEKLYPINNNGYLTIDDNSKEKTGTIEGLGLRTGYDDGNASNTNARYSGAELTINGGTFKNVYSDEGAALFVYQGHVNVHGGKFLGQNIAISNTEGGYVYIHGGCYIDGYNSAIVTKSTVRVYETAQNVDVSGRCEILNGGEFEIDDENDVTFYQARIGDATNWTSYKTFAEALTAAEEGDEVYVFAGTYNVPTGKDLTITGAVDGVVFDNIGAKNMGSANVTFNNVTFDYYPNVNYTGLQHSGNLVYNNCIINGQVFLYGTSETFNNCTFNQNSADAYNVWTYGAKEVAFNEGAFNSAGKSVFVYNEGACATDLTVKETTFNATTTVDGKAAIEINTQLMPAGTEIVVDGATTAEGFSENTKSGSSLWNDKMVVEGAPNGGTNSKVTVDNVVVKEAAAAKLAGAGTEEDPYLINNIDDLVWFRYEVNDKGTNYQGKFVELKADIDLNNEDWTPIGTSNNTFNGMFDGGDHTISNLYINDSKEYVSGGNNENYVGFFGYMKGGNTAGIKNLNIKNVNITGCLYVGSVLGRSYTGGIIENCHVTGSIKIDSYSYAGGIVGRHEYSKGKNVNGYDMAIYNCSVIGDVQTRSNENTNFINADYTVSYVGGVVGFIAEGNYVIDDCSVSNVNVSGTYGVGGISGIAHYGNTLSKVSVDNVRVVSTNNNPESERTNNIGLIAGAVQGTTQSPSIIGNVEITETTGSVTYTDGSVKEVTDIYGTNMDGSIPVTNYEARIGVDYYETFAGALAAVEDNQTITLLKNINITDPITIKKFITLDGNGLTLTYTGTDRAIDVPNNANANIDVTVKNLTVVATTANRGLNYNENGVFNVEGVIVTIGENVDGYAINFPGMADNAQVTIKDSKLTSRNPLNIWGENMTINVYDSEIISVDNSTTFDYAAIQLNNDNYGNVANGTVVNVYRGTITALNDNDEPSNVVANATETGVVNISDETIVTGKVLNYVANIGGVYFGSLQAAVNAIEKYGYNSPIVIMKSFATSETATVKNDLNVTIDLNGKTITVTDNTTKNFEAIKNQGTLTIKDSSADKTGKITVTATTNSGWNRYSAVIANTVGGKLTVDGGTLEHLGGTDMAYGIDNLTNGKGTYAETVINGGTIKSTYRGIRQFLNGIEAQNILTVNGGTIEGANKSIWMQDPNKNANTGTLTVGKDAKLYGDVYLFVTAGSTEWPVEVSIAAAALQGESTVVTANLPEGIDVQEVNGVYGVYSVVASIETDDEIKYYQTFEAALNAVQDGETITLLDIESSSELKKEIDFTKDIEFTITGTAPNYALPVVTFQNAIVNIKDAEILIPELDARQKATINVVNSTVHDAGGDGVVKSYYNGAINIDATSTVYTMQVTTMGYITVAGTLNATWQTNVYGNGLITLNQGATFNTAALHLTAQDYSGRDNTDAERFGKPAEIVVDGANFTVGKVYSDNGADYSYNSSKGINVGTVDGKSAILNIMNGGKVNIYMANGETTNFGAGATVNVNASTFNVACRAENGTATLTNNGTVNVTGEANLAAANVTGNGWFYMNGVTLDADTKLLGAKVRFASGTNNIDGSTINDGFFQVGIGAYNGTDANVDTENGVVVNVKNAVIGANGDTYAGWAGTGFYDTDTEKVAAMTSARYVLNIENSIAEFGYLHISNDGELNVNGNATEKAWYNNSDYSFYAGDFIINGTATFDATDVLAIYTKVSCDNGTTDNPGTLNIVNGTEYEAERHNGAVAGLNFDIRKTGIVNVAEGADLHVGEPASIAADATMNIGGTATVLGELTNNGTIKFTSETATLTVPTTGLTVNNATGNNDIKVVYENGTYKFIDKHYVAEIVGGAKYESLAEAVTAAQDGQTIKLIYAEGDAPIAMNASLYGKNVTIIGTATVDWSKGFLFVGRGGEGDATLTFDGANLTSASNSASYGIHVSGREKNTDNEYDGTLVIKNSTIVLDYLIQKNVMTLDNSTLTVKNGFSVGGRPASETETGADATATITLNNGSKVVVNNHNGMGLGYEAIGVMNIDATSTFETTQDFLITAKGTMNVNGGNVKVDGKLTNNGAVNIKDATVKLAKLENDNLMFIEGENTLQVEDASGSSFALRARDGVVFNNSYVKGTANETMRLLGSATFNGGFECAYLQGKSADESNPDNNGVGGTITIEEGTTVHATYGVEFSNNYIINGGTIKLSGGNADGNLWGFVFQGNKEYTINSDIVVNGGGKTAPIHFTKATAVVNGNITHSNPGGEVIYLKNSEVTFAENSVVTTTTGVHVNEGSTLTNKGNIAGDVTVNAELSNKGEINGDVTVNAKLSNKGEINGKVTVNGTLISENNITGNITKADAATIILTGGTYTQDVNEWCHADYDAIYNGNNTWTVIQVAGSQTRELATPGWYWFSTYIDLEGSAGLEKLQNAFNVEDQNGNIVCVGNSIKSRTQFSQYYDGYGWDGNLQAITTAQMYMINTDPVTLELTGDFVEAGRQIPLVYGWNSIGYPVRNTMSINDAFENIFVPTEGDVFKSKNKTSFYEDGEWFPEITLEPGHGYMYQSKSSESKTLVYKSNNNRNTENKTNIDEVDYHWLVDATQYPGNMTIVAMLSIDNEIVKYNYEIAAFANGECRGSARPMYNDRLGAYILILTIHGEEVEELTFKYYDVNYGTEYELSNRINYSDNAIVGSFEEPYMFNLGILNIDETSVENISIYPNPTTTGKEINLQAVCDKVEVFNALGVKVAEYTNVDSIDAIETAGIYVIRVTIDGNARNCRLVVR